MNNRKRSINKKKSRKRSKKKYMNSTGIKNKMFCLSLLILMIVSLYYILPDAITIKTGLDEYNDERIKQLIREVLAEQNQEITETKVEEIKTEIVENNSPKEVTEKVVKEEVKKEKVEVTSRGNVERTVGSISVGKYQITSYHPGDDCLSGTRTGSGKSTSDFGTMKIGNKNVYTYQGKIVVACATEELLKSGYNVKGGGTRQEGKHYFRYYDTGKLNIDGNWYDFIVLDSCGAAMWQGERRIDIFVPSSSDIVNRTGVEAKLNNC